jgi:hypothetical protein
MLHAGLALQPHYLVAVSPSATRIFKDDGYIPKQPEDTLFEQL